MKYDDLLEVPYILGGRTMAGLDCYGLVIECFRREGKALKDLALSRGASLDNHLPTLNVREVMEAAPGVGIQFRIGDRLHIGYMLSRRNVLHMTEQGMRVSPLLALSRLAPRFFEVVE